MSAHEEDCEGIEGESETCESWCFSCEACEPLREGDFKTCPECWHVFRTPKELVDKYVESMPEGDQWARPAADDINTCPECLHDF